MRDHAWTIGRGFAIAVCAVAVIYLIVLVGMVLGMVIGAVVL